jgi:hypothetical protein
MYQVFSAVTMELCSQAIAGHYCHFKSFNVDAQIVGRVEAATAKKLTS